MLAKATKLALVTTALLLLAANANAQQGGVHPICAKSKDKVKCNCVFTNGGTIDNFSGRRRVHIWTIGQHDAYIACMKRNGREP
jgi:hypothetical protein